jgi:hydroxymethylpyrimidine kinase/phosphomethylpyrimidine kinase
MSTERKGETPVVLTVAGFDPSGGAGIIADIKTIIHFGCRPAAAITSLTFQNSAGVFGAIHESARSLRAQILPVVEEHRIAGLKIGMLPTAELVSEMARLISETNLPSPVIDPVLRSSSGYDLVEPEALEILQRDLLPMARLVTPNIPEAEALIDRPIADESAMIEAAQVLNEPGAPAVLIKGGHLLRPSQFADERQAVDVLCNQGEITVFRSEWFDAPPLRGTGCMLSSAIAACLALGMELEEAVRLAKEFVGDAIFSARGLRPETHG